MMRLIALAALCATPSVAMTPDITTPSGQSVILYDVVLEDDINLARFRFLAPRISRDEGDLTYTHVADDFVFLCDEIALPALIANNWASEQIVISLSDQEVEFGVITPQATQFFEQFSVQNDACIWEAF